MKTSELLLSILDITEDEYSYKGQFTLSTPDKTKSRIVDITDLESASIIKTLIELFSLDDDPADVRRILMDKIMEKAYISSVIFEGET